MHVFVDYDGTLTDDDTLDVLTRHVAGDAAWDAIDQGLERGDIQLRDALAQQLALVGLPIDRADALLQTLIVFDATFAGFLEECRRRGVGVTILSSGVKELILLTLERNGIHGVPVVASTVDDLPDGWILHFHDDVPNGTDKAGIVSAMRDSGISTVFIGDGHSDYDAALVADTRFAKHGRALERFLKKKSVPFVAFNSFDDIGPVLFASEPIYGI